MFLDEETESREYFTAVSEILRPSRARIAVECKKDEWRIACTCIPSAKFLLDKTVPLLPYPLFTRVWDMFMNRDKVRVIKRTNYPAVILERAQSSWNTRYYASVEYLYTFKFNRIYNAAICLRIYRVRLKYSVSISVFELQLLHSRFGLPYFARKSSRR